MPRPLLRARWLDLLIASYRVDASALEPHLPGGLELDEWQGSPYASLVAFDFTHVRMRGVPVPGNTRFPEWNLRFYVREKAGVRRRGVVFIREIVPKPLVSLGARLLYNEPYETRPMTIEKKSSADRTAYAHTLRHTARDMAISWSTGSAETLPDEESEAHFFKEHAWGYGRTRGGRTLVYNVQHPVWATRAVHDLDIDIDGAALYGEPWGIIGQRPPDSVVFALGSAVEVYMGKPL